jgi:hypothetical protein
MNRTLGQLLTPSLDLRAEAHLIAVGILIVAGVLDGLLAWLGGNQSTLSRCFLDLEGHRPHVALLMAYSGAVLIWHLCVPSLDPVPPLWEAILKAVAVCIPILVVFGEIAATTPGIKGPLFRATMNSVESPNSAGLVLLVMVGTLAGWTAAYFGASQHIAAGG